MTRYFSSPVAEAGRTMCNQRRSDGWIPIFTSHLKAGPFWPGVHQERQQSRQMRVVSGDQDVARFAAQAIAQPRGWIFRLQISRRGELREGIARTPKRFSRLLRPQLAAVPHDGRFDTARRGELRETIDRFASPWRQRPARIDVRTNCFTMVDKNQAHRRILERCQFGGTGRRGGNGRKGKTVPPIQPLQPVQPFLPRSSRFSYLCGNR